VRSFMGSPAGAEPPSYPSTAAIHGRRRRQGGAGRAAPAGGGDRDLDEALLDPAATKVTLELLVHERGQRRTLLTHVRLTHVREEGLEGGKPLRRFRSAAGHTHRGQQREQGSVRKLAWPNHITVANVPARLRFPPPAREQARQIGGREPLDVGCGVSSRA